MSKNPNAWLALSAIALGFLASTSSEGHAATLYVANNGLDSPGCGRVTAPCRSINQSISLASNGDRILVGPGVYGDLDGDGFSASAPGEEGWSAPTTCSDCMIHVDKSVTLESTAGAAATVLRSGNAGTAVLISTDRVVFGRRGRGFTLSGISAFTPFTPQRDGLTIISVAPPSPTEVRVEDNVVMDYFFGLTIYGSAHTITNNVASMNVVGFVGRFVGSGSVIRGNDGSNNTNEGFQLRTFDAEREVLTVTENRAVGNGTEGFNLGGDNMTVTANHSSANGQSGFALSVTNHMKAVANHATANGRDGFELVDGGANMVVAENVAAGNKGHGFSALFVVDGLSLTANIASHNGPPDASSGTDGFYFQSAGNMTMTGNTATANTRYGAYVRVIDTRAAVVTRNALLGNRRGGIVTNSMALVTQNNIFGNGASPNDLNSALNCGVINASLELLNAEDNFWGAPTGPGDDPADVGCQIVTGFVIDVVPYATRAFRIPVKAVQ